MKTTYQHSFEVVSGELIVTENKFQDGKPAGYTYYSLGVKDDSALVELAKALNELHGQSETRFTPKNSQIFLSSVARRFEASQIKNKSYRFIGTCDRIRMTDTGEQNWRLMVIDKMPMTFEDFEAMADRSVLDDGESMSQWIGDIRKSDPEAEAYRSNWGNKECIFLQTAGFEYIFVKE